jgi:hypothetical protein
MTDKQLKLLKKLEWSATKMNDFGHNDYSPVPCCPECGAVNWSGTRPPYPHLHEGHKPGCELGAAILELGG